MRLISPNPITTKILISTRRKIVNKKLRLFLTLFLIFSITLPVFKPTGFVKAADTRELVILGTSDIHGNVDNYDYFTDSVPTGSSQRGLTKIQTYVKTLLASNPNTILIDNGDTIQGNPLAYYFN